MPFFTNSLNFPNLTLKAVPVGADLVLIADSAAANAPKQATVTSIAAAAGGGGLTLIASVTAANSASVNFDNRLSATYDNYIIVYENVLPVTDAVNLKMQFGTGAGPTYQATNYSDLAYGSTTTVPLTPAASLTTSLPMHGTAVGVQASNVASRTASGQTLISGINSATDKTFINSTIYWASAATPQDALGGGAGRWQSATVVTSVKFFFSTGNISTGTFKLYGLSN